MSNSHSENYFLKFFAFEVLSLSGTNSKRAGTGAVKTLIMAKQKINVQGASINIYSQNENDYISLTDIAKNFSDTPKNTIRNWLRNGSTLAFLIAWENIKNTDFSLDAAKDFLLKSRDNSFNISPKLWIEETKAIGMNSKAGRYGGTYAHSDLAINFCYWLKPEFQAYFIHEFQRLKADEARRLGEHWDVNRYLSKVNYHIHTDSIKEFLVIPKNIPRKSQSVVYASEADVLNMAVFGITAKSWRLQNAEKEGNIRDYATTTELQVLANLEVLNAKLIQLGFPQHERLADLTETAEQHFDIINQKPYKPKKRKK